jgi:hypothetical protein
MSETLQELKKKLIEVDVAIVLACVELGFRYAEQGRNLQDALDRARVILTKEVKP